MGNAKICPYVCTKWEIFAFSNRSPNYVRVMLYKCYILLHRGESVSRPWSASRIDVNAMKAVRPSQR